MKTALVSLGLLTLLAGCTAAPASPSSTPTATQTVTETATATATPSPTAASSSPAPSTTPTPSKEPAKPPVALDQAYSYADGLRVEVVKVKLTRLSEEGGMDTELAPGVPIQILSVRITNGTGARVNLDESDAVLTYGPKRREATAVDDVGTKTLYGKLASGASKTGRYGFVTPKNKIDSVVLTVTVDGAHPHARFKGSLA